MSCLLLALKITCFAYILSYPPHREPRSTQVQVQELMRERHSIYDVLKRRGFFFVQVNNCKFLKAPPARIQVISRQNFSAYFRPLILTLLQYTFRTNLKVACSNTQASRTQAYFANFERDRVSYPYSATDTYLNSDGDYGLDSRGIRIPFPVEARDFSVHHSVQTGCGARQPHFHWVKGLLLLG